MYFDTLILRLRRTILFQQLLLIVRDWYKQCGCVGAWAKYGVYRQQRHCRVDYQPLFVEGRPDTRERQKSSLKALRKANKKRQFEELK